MPETPSDNPALQLTETLFPKGKKPTEGFQRDMYLAQRALIRHHYPRMDATTRARADQTLRFLETQLYGETACDQSAQPTHEGMTAP